jgi:hypothetical protein
MHIQDNCNTTASQALYGRFATFDSRMLGYAMSAIRMAPETACKLAKLLGMLGSDHDGEVIAAGHQANRLVSGSGLTWPQFINAPVLVDDQREDSEALQICLRHPEYLTPWKMGFVETLSRRQIRRPSDKQRAVLQRLARKCAGGEYA